MTKITIDRITVEQALETLELSTPELRITDDDIPKLGWKEHNAAIIKLRSELAEPTQLREHCLWARNGNKPCPHVQQVEQLAWMRVIDEAMVVHHCGVADPADDYETAKRKMNNLLCTAQDIGTYFAKQAESEPCQYPDCVDNGPDVECTRWLLDECSMGEDYKRRRPAEPVQEPGSLMIAAQQFLEWNRSQTPPRVEIGFELGVFEAAMKTYTSPPQRKENT